MQLSILIARIGLVFWLAPELRRPALGGAPNVDVIIRDNSSDAKKRALLPQFERDNCNIIIAEPCDALTNISEILNLAKGEFIFISPTTITAIDHAIAWRSRT